MKFSIITPVYNSSKYLRKMIESVLNQNYKNFEFILVDDGSTDNSYEIMSSYSSDKRVQVYQKENSGPGFARKYGFEKATGDLLFFVDSDDWLVDKNVLKNIEKLFEEQNMDVLIFDRILYPEKKILKPFDNDLEPGCHSINEMYNNNIRGGLGLKIFKSSIFTLDMFSNTSNHEDFFSTFLYFDKCKKMYYENSAFYAVNRYDDNISLTKRFNYEKVIEGAENIIKMYQIIENPNLKQSVAYKAFGIYMNEYLIPLLKFKLKIKNIVSFNKTIKKEFKKIILDNDISYFINQTSAKRKLLYKLFIKKKVL